MLLLEELGRKVDADVLVATDPDADRLGVEIRQPDGSYLNLSGNQIGAIIAKYILEAHKQLVPFLPMLPSVNQSYQLSW